MLRSHSDLQGGNTRRVYSTRLLASFTPQGRPSPPGAGHVTPLGEPFFSSGHLQPATIPASPTPLTVVETEPFRSLRGRTGGNSCWAPQTLGGEETVRGGAHSSAPFRTGTAAILTGETKSTEADSAQRHAAAHTHQVHPRPAGTEGKGGPGVACARAAFRFWSSRASARRASREASSLRFRSIGADTGCWNRPGSAPVLAEAPSCPLFACTESRV